MNLVFAEIKGGCESSCNRERREWARPVMGVRHVQLLTVDAGTTFARPGRISTLDHKVLNIKTMSESLRGYLIVGRTAMIRWNITPL